MTDRTITLCADDYGLAPGVGVAIRHLIGLGRLHATGCMTSSPFWPAEAPLLVPLAGQAHVGVHLTLTDQAPLGPMPVLAPEGRLPSVGALLKRCLSGQVPVAEIEAELIRQIDAFEAHFGRPPDFLDGHHHVQQFPGIGPITARLWRDRLGGRGWVRSCWDSPAAILRRGVDPVRALVIGGLGWAFRRRLQAMGIPHNRSFRGVYGFAQPFGPLFERFIARPGPACLMMVHPGQVDDALRAADILTGQREDEWAFLASDGCADALRRQGVRLARLMAP